MRFVLAQQGGLSVHLATWELAFRHLMYDAPNNTYGGGHRRLHEEPILLPSEQILKQNCHVQFHNSQAAVKANCRQQGYFVKDVCYRQKYFKARNHVFLH